MILLNFASNVSQPHFNGVREQVYVLKGSALIGEIENPKLLTQRENLEFNADIPHIYKAMSNEVVLLVTIYYPKNYKKYFYEDRFIQLFNNNYFDKIKQELENGIDTIRIFAKERDFDFDKTIKNIQIINTDAHIFVSKIRTNNLVQIKKYLKNYTFDVLNHPNEKKSFAYRLLTNELSILNQQAQNSIENSEFQLNNQTQRDESNFERRINVDLYSFFEYFHPGYTFQALLISAFLKQYPKQTILDIGSGPGNHLNLLNYFTENKFRFKCVEPSSKSIFYLQKLNNIETIYNDSFLTLQFQEKFNTLLSVGSSHHMNLSMFLEKSFKLLHNGGFLIISDEFIAKYYTKTQREKNLILHHTSYMLKVMFPIRNLPDKEKELYNLLRENIPYARYLAINNDIALAKNILNNLFNQIKHYYIQKVSNNLIAYYLFMILELEALIAGLDYEEECKTYSKNLITIAEEIGFETIIHLNFYPTYKDGGTQLIILRKSE
jgi:SAM-dependent methyltransferase